MVVEITRLLQYSMRLPSPRVGPSYSLSDVQWINETSSNRKTFLKCPSKKIKYTGAAIAGALTIVILIFIAILIPTINTSKQSSTTEDSQSVASTTIILNISPTVINSLPTASSTAGNTIASVITTSTSTSMLPITSDTSTTTLTTAKSTTTTITTGSTTTITSTESTTTTTATESTSTTTTTTKSTTTTTSTESASTTTTTTKSTTSTTSTQSTTTIYYGTLQWNTTGVTVAGKVGSNTANAWYFYFPIGIKLDSFGRVYVADSKNNRIQRFNPGNNTGTTVAGQSNGTAGNNDTCLNYPNHIAVDSNNNIYIADSNNHRIQLWYANSMAGITVAGNGTAGNSLTQLNSPRGVALDPNSNTFYVSDSYNNRIMSYTLNSTVGTIVAGGNGPGRNNTQLNDPRGLYYDTNTNSLVIANQNSSNIVRWVIGASSWTLVAGYLNGSTNNDSFGLNQPYDVTQDAMGNIYVADRYNQRIQFFSPGVLNGTTIAGVAGVIGTNATLFNGPIAVALDSQLNLYVSDAQNSRVQKFTRY